MILHKVDIEAWNDIAEKAYLSVFNSDRPTAMNTFDYALFVTDDDDKPVCYTTCLEFDSESIYMQHGGAFPEAQKTVKTARGYHLMIAFLREHYKQATTRILNINRPMLRLADSAGFVINGVDVHGEAIYLHLINKFVEDDEG